MPMSILHTVGRGFSLASLVLLGILLVLIETYVVQDRSLYSSLSVILIRSLAKSCREEEGEEEKKLKKKGKKEEDKQKEEQQ